MPMVAEPLDSTLSNRKVVVSSFLLSTTSAGVRIEPSDWNAVLFDDEAVFGERDKVERQGRIRVTIGFTCGPEIQRHVGTSDAGIMDPVLDDLDAPMNVAEEDAPDPIAMGNEGFVKVVAVE